MQGRERMSKDLQKDYGASKVEGDRFRASKKRRESHCRDLCYGMLQLLKVYVAQRGSWINLYKSCP